MLPGFQTATVMSLFMLSHKIKMKKIFDLKNLQPHILGFTQASLTKQMHWKKKLHGKRQLELRPWRLKNTHGGRWWCISRAKTKIYGIKFIPRVKIAFCTAISSPGSSSSSSWSFSLFSFRRRSGDCRAVAFWFREPKRPPEIQLCM